MARVWVESVGCKISRADAEKLWQELVAAGHSPARAAAEADVAVLTTCCVTAEAERSSRQRVRRLAAQGASVVVTGCAAVYRPEQFGDCTVVPRSAVRETVAGLPLRSPDDAVDAGGDQGVTAARSDRSGRTRAVVKVQDGCTSRCTYCAVRLVRGEPWSLPVADALEAAAAALAGGCGEIVLSGINLGTYAGAAAVPPPDDAAGGPAGAAPGSAASGAAPDSGPADLAALVALLAELPGLRRLRLSSLEPQHVSPRLLAALAHPRVARHLHLPLQSADNAVLADMGRPYSFADYLDRVAAVRKALPGVLLTTDVIVGFPTESPAAFERTLRAIGAPSALFGRVHVFTFSPRPGTPAAALAPLPAAELRRRRTAAVAAAAETRSAAAERLVGRRLEVLVEDRREGLWRGYSSEYARCRVRGPARRGTIVEVLAQQACDGILECSTLPAAGASPTAATEGRHVRR